MEQVLAAPSQPGLDRGLKRFRGEKLVWLTLTANCSLNCFISLPSRVRISCLVSSSPALLKVLRSLSRWSLVVVAV